jgi:hypothetical protein
MRVYFWTVLAASLAGAALAIGGGQAAGAAELSDMSGTYYGIWANPAGERLSMVVRLTLQSNGRAAGAVSIGARYVRVPIQGTCNRAGTLNLSGRAGTGLNTVQISLRGVLHDDQGGRVGLIDGDGVALTRRRETANFRVRAGLGNQ